MLQRRFISNVASVSNCSSVGIFPFKKFSTSAVKNPKTGIVLLNLGGPQTTNDVQPFLLRLFADHEIIPLPFQSYLGPMIAKFRTPRVKKLYEGIGGGSPIKKWTEKQGEQMVKILDEISPDTAPHKFYIAFRYANPLTDEALIEMKKDGVKRAVAFTQYPQFSCSTTGGSLNELWRGLKRLNLKDEFEWSVVDRWPVHSGFVHSVAERVKEGLDSFPTESDRKDAIILFSAHSLPLSIVNRGDSYPQEVSATIHRVMEQLNFSNHYISTWQSAVGPRSWLGPQTVDVVKKLATKGHHNVLVVPIAFTSDHIETLSEIDREIAEEAHKLGMKNFRRAPSLNDSPHFAKAMADIVADHLVRKELHTPQYLRRCAGCTNDHCRNIVNPAHK